MDILSAHQLGLLDQLNDEIAALAGAPRDFGQRAVVLHHLYDHSRGAHGWALAEARRNLLVAQRLSQLERRAGRWAWLGRKGDSLAETRRSIGEQMRLRTVAAYRAYRLSATAALRQSAGEELPADLLALLDQCHAARRSGGNIPGAALLEATEANVPAVGDVWSTWLGRVMRRDGRRGPARIERLLLADKSLPAAFRANPAQHFYALQNSLAERRRSEWRTDCDLLDQVGLAA